MTKRNGGSIIRVLLTAASSVRRAGLETLIKNAPSLRLVGSFRGLHAVGQHVEQLQPDVVLIDFENQSHTASSHALPQIPNTFPVVALIDEPSATWASSALRSSVKAILPRDSDLSEILPAIQTAHAGLVLLDPEVTQNLASRIPTRIGRPAFALDGLTPREIEVLRMLAD